MNLWKFVRDWWMLILAGAVAVGVAVASKPVHAMGSSLDLSSEHIQVAGTTDNRAGVVTTSASCKERYQNAGGEISTLLQVSESTLTIKFPHQPMVAFEDHSPYMDYLLGIADAPTAFAALFKDGAVLLVSAECGDPIILKE